MSAFAEAIPLHGEDDPIIPVRTKAPKHSRLVHNVNARSTVVADPANTTLLQLCQQAIAADLERYPPASLGVLAQDDWEGLILVRHANTTPKEGTGGLDGTGRIAPAVPDKFLASVEEVHPHLQESDLVDRLLWKDCVEWRFRRGGLTRPRGLLLPWPVLVEAISSAASQLTDPVHGPEALRTLEESPMNVSLLQASGAGKVVRRAVKTLKKEGTNDTATARLEYVLRQWMSLAADSGEANPFAEDEEDLQTVESCHNWRQLFAALKQRDEDRVSNQGKRMREIRRNLASGRPKVVKVRPTSKKHQRFLDGPTRATAPDTNHNISRIRQEAATVAMRQQRGPVSPSRSSFGAAVAFATSAKKKLPSARRPPPSRAVSLSGGKRMHVPTKVVQGAGPRQFASK